MKNRLYKLMNWPKIESIIYSEESNPFNILGPKISTGGVLFQTFYPKAEKIDLCIKPDSSRKVYPMEMADEEGFFACIIPGKTIPDYEYEVTKDGRTFTVKDAYSYDGFEMPEEKTELLKQGLLYDSYNYLGAFECSLNSTVGTRFAVWAPNAVRVSVVGDFNGFDGRMHQMKKNDKEGIFEIFIPGVKTDDKYLYEIKVRGGQTQLKLDPYSKYMTEEDGEIYSVVYKSDYSFKHDDKRKGIIKGNVKDSPTLMYEVSLSHFDDKEKDYVSLAKKIAAHVTEMGYTHVLVMPPYESRDSFGYSTLGFYAPDSKGGRPDDLKCFVDIMHENGIGVIFDWAPFHFPKDERGLCGFDGTCLYEHLDPRKGIHPFYGTYLFNYGRPEVKNFLISNALYYINEYHIDGLKMDSVSSMLYLDYGRDENSYVPNIYGGNEDLDAIEFIKHLNSIVKKDHPEFILIAEEESGYPLVTEKEEEEGLGFDLKFNEGLSADYLRYISFDPYFRSHHHQDITLSMLYQYSEDYINGFIGKSFIDSAPLYDIIPGDDIDKFNTFKLTFGYLYTHPGKKTVFEGLDIMDKEKVTHTWCPAFKDLKNPDNKGVRNFIKELNKIYLSYPALYELDNSIDGFEWINCIAADECMLSFMRKTKNVNDTLIVVCNFANVQRTFDIGTPLSGKYKEILNSDDKKFGGSNYTNKKSIPVSEEGADKRDYSIRVKAAPLSVSIFKYSPFTEKEQFKIDKKKEAALANTKALEYKNEALKAKDEYESALKLMEDAKKAMNAAKKKMDDYTKKENEELLKAKKALEEAK